MSYSISFSPTFLESSQQLILKQSSEALAVKYQHTCPSIVNRKIIGQIFACANFAIHLF